MLKSSVDSHILHGPGSLHLASAQVPKGQAQSQSTATGTTATGDNGADGATGRAKDTVHIFDAGEIGRTSAAVDGQVKVSLNPGPCLVHVANGGFFIRSNFHDNMRRILMFWLLFHANIHWSELVFVDQTSRARRWSMRARRMMTTGALRFVQACTAPFDRNGREGLQCTDADLSPAVRRGLISRRGSFRRACWSEVIPERRCSHWSLPEYCIALIR